MTEPKKPRKKPADQKSVPKLDAKSKGDLVKKVSTVDPLHPYNIMACPRCKVEFAKFKLNRLEHCDGCGKGFYVTKAHREFFVLG